jgi:hypothetical protein
MITCAVFDLPVFHDTRSDVVMDDFLAGYH